MRGMHRQRVVGFLALAACVWACDGNDSPLPTHDNVFPLSAVESVATLNAGTHPLLDLIEPSPVREICDVWYGNDLCTTEAEALVAGAIVSEAPDILLLQEIWDQTLCDDPERPAASAESPFVCSAGDGHQMGRVLPPAYSFACGTDVPGTRDALNCIAFKRSVFTPRTPQGGEATCRGRDCSDLLEVLETACDSQWGKIILLRGRTEAGPAVLASVHLFLDASVEALNCQAEQVRVLSDALGTLPEETVVVVAGDFNLDLRLPLPAAGAVVEMQEAHALALLGETAPTNLMIPLRLDMIFTRGWEGAAGAECEVFFLNPEAGPPMVDHGLVLCR